MQGKVKKKVAKKHNSKLDTNLESTLNYWSQLTRLVEEREKTSVVKQISKTMTWADKVGVREVGNEPESLEEKRE